jgi:hypothetical protein
LSNFPIELFDECLDSVLGIYLGSDNNDIIENFNNIQDYFSQMTKCFFKNVFRFNMKKYEKYIIYFNVEKTDWSVNKDNKEKLYNYGYNF